MKRFNQVNAAVFAIAISLAGCGGGNQGDSTSANADSQKASGTAASATVEQAPSRQGLALPKNGLTMAAAGQPDAPGGLAATVISSRQINLSWSASTDDDGIAGYRIFRNGSSTPVVQTREPSFSDKGVVAGMTYNYVVKAFDSLGHESPASNTVMASTPTEASFDASVDVDQSTVLRTSAFTPGYTFDQCTFRADNGQCGRSAINADAAKSAERLLSGMGAHIANVQIYGWGVDNPEPSPGVYNLGSLYARLNIIRRTQGTPMITLCCSPDWMAGGQPGQSYSDAMYRFPKPEHYDRYAALSAKIAQENPDVKMFQVWNEFKGLYATNGSYNQWDYVAYTTLYNKIYDAVKKVRPDAEIGGPYPVIVAWTQDSVVHPSGVKVAGLELDQRPLDTILYWLQNKHGAQFITIDGGNGAKNMSEKTGGAYTQNGYQMCNVFGAAVDWIRSLDANRYPGAKTLPVVWAEWYAYPHAEGDKASTMAQCLIPTILSGARSALIWGAEGYGTTGDSFPLGFWTGTAPGGGQPTPFYTIAKGVGNNFGPGTKLLKTTISGTVGALASPEMTMLVNHAAKSIKVRLNGAAVVMPAYATVFVDNTQALAGGVYNDTAFAYNGNWSVSSGTEKYNGDDHYSSSAGATATLAFSGQQVELSGAIAGHHGIAAIKIDDSAETLVDLYAATRQDQAVVYVSPVLAKGIHTLQVRVTGNRNPQSAGMVVAIDRLRVINSVQKFNDTALTYSGAWNVSSGADKYGNDDHYSQSVDASASATFTGTQVRLVGARASHHGMAAVRIDGGSETMIDLYASARQDQATIYVSPLLKKGTHTVSVRVTGNRNPQSSGSVVALDRFDVLD